VIFFLATYSERKPNISDEDNAASMYRDVAGMDSSPQNRAWMAVMWAGITDYIDFSIQVEARQGTESHAENSARWMKEPTIYTFL